MAATVNVPASSPAKKHPEGRAVQVNDGHLSILDGHPRSGSTAVIAIYAPGSWTSAEIVEDEG